MISLTKGSKVNLKKEDALLKKLEVGLGWDTRTDLDTCAFLFKDNKVKDTVSFVSKRKQGIFLNGDNLTGAGDGDDEIITVTLNEWEFVSVGKGMNGSIDTLAKLIEHE